MGFDTGLSTTHIIPIILKDEQLTLRAKEMLFANGILVSAVRPPTVPSGTSRIRIALSTKCSNADIEKFLMVMNKINYVLQQHYK